MITDLFLAQTRRLKIGLDRGALREIERLKSHGICSQQRQTLHWEPELTVRQASLVSGLTGRRMQQLASAGEMRVRQIGRMWLIEADSLRQWLRTPRRPGPKGHR